MRPRYLVILVLALIGIVAILSVLLLSERSNPAEKTPTPTPTPTPKTDAVLSQKVSYSVPEELEAHDCANGMSVYLTPKGAPFDCSTAATAPIRMTLNSSGPTDCSQLQPAQSVTKHTCSSLFIDGRKTLKVVTEYSQAATPNVAAYHIDAKPGVASIEYRYKADQIYLRQFEDLARSVTIKP
jgi:hypothetical protein